MISRILKVKYKSILLLISICCVVLFYSHPTMASSAVNEVIYQVDQNYPPLTYSHDNRIYGFDPDFTNLIFNSADYQVDYSYDGWSKVYERIVGGEIDIAGIIAVTEERKKEVLFTNTLFSSSVSIYTRSDFRKIRLEDLSNLKVGVGKGYYTEEILKNNLEIANYIPYEDMNQALYELENGIIDVIFEDQWLMDSILVASKEKGEVVAQIEDLYPLPHAYAISKSRPDLVEYMNRRIKVLKQKGIFDEIYVKYFYSHSDYYNESQRIRILYITSIVAASVILILMLMKMYIDLLKKKLLSNYIKLENANNELETANETLQSQYEEIQSQYEEIQAQYEEIQAQCEEIQAQCEEIDQSKRELETSEERYRLIAECANDGLFDWNVQQDMLFLTEKWANRLGYQGSSIQDFSLNWRNSINKEDELRVHEQFLSCRQNKEEYFTTEFQMLLEKGQYIWVLVKGKLVWDNSGKMVRVAGSISDVNEQKKYEDRIYRLAYYDYLTNLPNRVALNEKMISIFSNVSDTTCLAALYYVDLDNFKHINDTLGHTYGDLLLQAMADALLLLKQENYYPFRVGGDEFIIIIDNLYSMDEIVLWAEKILDLLQGDWIIPEGETYVSTSIGITVIPDDGKDVPKILKNADAAMYVAKDAGKGKYKFFHEDMLHKVEVRSDLEKSIRKAIENKEFDVYYQPYYNMMDGSIAGMEALIRWFHPQKGLISPADFIPLAEETGLIKEIGVWVLEKVCYQNKKWQDQGFIKIPIAVNVSELQLEDRGFIHDLEEIIHKTDLDPKYLHIEITESCIMQSIHDSVDTLNNIRKMGIEIALDDFGTGYSSLNYLQYLPIATVKIDKSFTDEIIKRPSESLILREIISIAHKLNMNVIAEGVETKEQTDYLIHENCDIIQGYYYCKPLSCEQIEQVLFLGEK